MITSIPGGKLFPPSFRGYQPYSACAVTGGIRVCCNTTKTDRRRFHVFVVATEDGNENEMRGQLDGRDSSRRPKWLAAALRRPPTPMTAQRPRYHREVVNDAVELAPQPKQYCQCCHRQLRRFFVCANCARRCCVLDCLAVNAHGNYCIECRPPPPIQPADVNGEDRPRSRDRDTEGASALHTPTCAICARATWLLELCDGDCGRNICNSCAAPWRPDDPGLVMCPECIARYDEESDKGAL